MITHFTGMNRFLSNFYRRKMTIDGWSMPTLEHWFVIRKVGTIKEFLDEAERVTGKELCIFDLEQMTPGQMKQLGRKITLRLDWEDVKIDVMKHLLEIKFLLDPEMGRRLLGTRGHELQEGNRWHDQFWGVCYCPYCDKQEGRNHLGKLLMDVREMLDTEGF